MYLSFLSISNTGVRLCLQTKLRYGRRATLKHLCVSEEVRTHYLLGWWLHNVTSAVDSVTVKQLTMTLN